MDLNIYLFIYLNGSLILEYVVFKLFYLEPLNPSSLLLFSLLLHVYWFFNYLYKFCQ